MIEGLDEKVYSIKLSYKDIELLMLALAEIENSKTKTIIDTLYEPKNIDARKMCSNIISRFTEMTSTVDTLCKSNPKHPRITSDFSFMLSILEK